MTEEEIRAQLQEGSDRWGANNQPELKHIAQVLAALPIADMKVDYDRLWLKFSRPLTGAEGFAIAQLGADLPASLEDPVLEVELWWD